MAQSSIVRRLGPKFFDLIDHVRELDLPADGIPLAVFGLRLTGVPPNHVEEVASALARKGAIWIGEERGVKKVFHRKPEGISWRREAKPIDDVLARIAPHAGAIAENLRLEREGIATVDKVAAWALIEAAAKRALKEVAKALAHGMTLELLRCAIHDVFNADVVNALSNADPTLRIGSDAKSLATWKAYPRLEEPAVERLADRVGLEIERRGSDGAGRTDLLRSIRPCPSAAELSAALDELDAAGSIDSVVMLAPGAYRKATRYFRPEHLPDLDQHGRPLKAF